MILTQQNSLEWYIKPCSTCDISVKDVLDSIPVNAACKSCDQYKKWFTQAYKNNNYMNSGYVYAPYKPMVCSTPLTDLFKKSTTTNKYDKYLNKIDQRYYGKIQITKGKIYGKT